MTALTFKNHTLVTIQHNGQDWIGYRQIADALGYKRQTDLHAIYVKHKDEFTPSMVCKLPVQTNGGVQEVLAFSLRGAHLLAMFSRTPIAKAFRQWVLDVLEGKDSHDIASYPDEEELATNAYIEFLVDGVLQEMHSMRLEIAELMADKRRREEAARQPRCSNPQLHENLRRHYAALGMEWVITGKNKPAHRLK